MLRKSLCFSLLTILFFFSAEAGTTLDFEVNKYTYLGCHNGHGSIHLKLLSSGKSIVDNSDWVKAGRPSLDDPTVQISIRHVHEIMGGAIEIDLRLPVRFPGRIYESDWDESFEIKNHRWDGLTRTFRFSRNALSVSYGGRFIRKSRRFSNVVHRGTQSDLVKSINGFDERTLWMYGREGMFEESMRNAVVEVNMPDLHRILDIGIKVIDQNKKRFGERPVEKGMLEISRLANEDEYLKIIRPLVSWVESFDLRSSGIFSAGLELDKKLGR